MKNVFIIHGPRGRGKTSLMLHIYQNLQNSNYTSMHSTDNNQFTRSMSAKSSSTRSARSGDRSSKSSSANSVKSEKKELKPFYMFYFLKPQDLIITVLIDIICKMRLRYTNKGKLIKKVKLLDGTETRENGKA